MRLKKILSVFLAALMMFSVMSLGITASAKEISYDAQFILLADALKKEHVRDLTNYTVENVTLDNETGGFDTEARGFAYDHRVIAADNEASDILVAANRFYYIAESVMSFEYGIGLYEPGLLLDYMKERLRPHFASTSGGGEVIYEDFYGNRYYPSEEEIAAYNKAVSDILAVGATVGQASLTEVGIYFMEMDDWSYYNVDTILRYFIGNVVKVNSGNWFHRFGFIVETSINEILEAADGVGSIPSDITMRKAAYEIDYQKIYNESKSKAYFAFAPTDKTMAFDSYGDDFGLTGNCADLTEFVGDNPGLFSDGQAEHLLVNVTVDSETKNYLATIEAKFDSYIQTGDKWDAAFINWSDATVNADPNKVIILSYAATLANEYSNAALKALFGHKLGNMVTLAYLFKPVREGEGADPVRTVRGTSTYVASADKFDTFIKNLDALVAPQDDDSSEFKVSNRVATVVSMFLDVGDLLGIEDEIDYTTLEDLIGKVLEKLVFSDGIVNMLVELVYPMLTDLLTDLLGNLTGVGFIDGLIGDILDDVISDNDLAIYPNDLGKRIEADYPGQYTVATTILKNAAGNSWENVNFDVMTWGVNDTPADKKSEAFLNALCAGLGGFTRLLVCLLCGDEEYETTKMQDVGNFGRYYDLKLIPALSGWLVSQGLYTKVFIPLYRVLGLKDGVDFLSSKDFHSMVVNDLTSCLREAIRPIIKFVTNYVAKKPFSTIMALVPNLVHFLSRTSTVPLSHKSDWESPSFVSGSQDECHKGFTDVQTYNLWNILDNCYLAIVGLVGAKIWSGSIASFLSAQSGMLSSINALLGDVLKLTYDTDKVAKENIAAYSDYNGNVVPADSLEYALNPKSYPNAHMQYYSDASNTKYSIEKDAEHPFLHQNLTYEKAPFYLPAIPEKKLTSCGTVYEPTTHNTIKVDDPGLVFKFLLRYLLSALGYRYTLDMEQIDDETIMPKVPTLIECLGLDLSSELFMGLSLGDIIDNVMLHPDEAICALLELFYSNEDGNLGEGIPHTYPVTPIDYHEDVLLSRLINPTREYGADVKYSEYWTKENANDFVASIGPLAEDVLVMLGLEGVEDGLGPFLQNMLDENVFNNDLANTLFNAIYQLLGGLNDSLGIDIEGVLDAVLDVNFSTTSVARTLLAMYNVETDAVRTISEAEDWMSLFYGGVEVDPITGEESIIINDVDLDWGIDNAAEYGYTRADAFLRVVSSLLSPAAFILKFLFMDQNLNILGLIELPAYPAYHYAFIGLLEALSCPGILTYDTYYYEAQDEVCGDANVIYNLFSPLLGLLEKVYVDPINTVLNLLPNLLFFISIGGLNDFINNLIHFAYVLVDILKPIINAYDLLEGLLANIDIGGLSLNLTLPLDIDVNSLISDLLGTLVGDSLTIEGVAIQLPYIDLYSICVGTVVSYRSAEQRTIARLDPAGGGELLTAVLRIGTEVLFMPENHQALSEIVSNLAAEGKLDEYDEETLYLVISGLIGLIEEYAVIDLVLFAVYMLISNLVPIADTLAERLEANDMTITDLIDSASDTDLFVENISKLLKDPNEVQMPDTTDTTGAIGGLFGRISALFQKIMAFFKSLFSFA